MSESLFALILVTTKSPLQVHKNSSQLACSAACRDRGTSAPQRPPGSHRSYHLYPPRPSGAACAQHLCRSPHADPRRVHTAGSPPRGAATAHGTCPPRPRPPTPGDTASLKKFWGRRRAGVRREAGAPSSRDRPRAGQHTLSLRELGAPTPKLPPPPRTRPPASSACAGRTRGPASLRPPARPAHARTCPPRPAGPRFRPPGPPSSPLSTLAGPRRGPAGPRPPRSPRPPGPPRAAARPSWTTAPKLLCEEVKPRVVPLNHPNKFPSPPPPSPRHARPSRRPLPAATHPGGSPVEAGGRSPEPRAPAPRLPLQPTPGSPAAGRPCGCGSRRVRVRARVCARAKAEVAAARRHSLLPGLAVGRDGAAVTLAFAVHACAESSSHCHAPVNPSQPPREQPRPHGDPRSHPHHWPPHARAPPSSPWQRARLTGLPSLRPAGARGGGSA